MISHSLKTTSLRYNNWKFFAPLFWLVRHDQSLSSWIMIKPNLQFTDKWDCVNLWSGLSIGYSCIVYCFKFSISVVWSVCSCAMASTSVSGKVRKSCQTSATARLKQDYIRIKSDPVPYISAEPLHSNILEWYVFNSLCVSHTHWKVNC